MGEGISNCVSWARQFRDAEVRRVEELIRIRLESAVPETRAARKLCS